MQRFLVFYVSYKMSLEHIRAFLEGSDDVELIAPRYTHGWSVRCGSRVGASQPGPCEAVSGKDDGPEPGADHSSDPCLYIRRAGAAEGVSRHRFAKLCTREDIELPACVDTAHETLSGPAKQKILYREFPDFGDQRYERLARLSAAQLYRRRRIAYQPTRANAGCHWRTAGAWSRGAARLPESGTVADGMKSGGRWKWRAMDAEEKRKARFPLFRLLPGAR